MVLCCQKTALGAGGYGHHRHCTSNSMEVSLYGDDKVVLLVIKRGVLISSVGGNSLYFFNLFLNNSRVILSRLSIKLLLSRRGNTHGIEKIEESWDTIHSQSVIEQVRSESIEGVSKEVLSQWPILENNAVNVAIKCQPAMTDSIIAIQSLDV